MNFSIANERSLLLDLDEDGGIAAPKKSCPMILPFQKGWVNFLPFFLPVQQESYLLIKSKDISYSSRRAQFQVVREWPTKVDQGCPLE